MTGGEQYTPQDRLYPEPKVKLKKPTAKGKLGRNTELSKERAAYAMQVVREMKEKIYQNKKQQLEEKRAEYRRLCEEEEEIKHKQLSLEERNKILFFGHEGKGYLGRYGKWEPNALQDKIFRGLESRAKRIFLMSGANQIGKTLAETCIVIGLLRGHWPWENPKEVGYHLWEVRGWKPPIRIRWIGGAWEGHISKVLIDKGLVEFWPSIWPVYSKKNTNGVIHLWRDEETGNEVQVMSTNQDDKEFEGWTGHAVIVDEPCSHKIWVACQRGLVANKGISMMGATLLSQPWINTEIINRFDANKIFDRQVLHVEGDIYNNMGYGLDQEGIEAFESAIPQHEREARIKGLSVFYSSLVLNINKDKNIIDRIVDFPRSWMVDVIIDIGIAKPHDILYLATSEKNIKYVIFEEEIRGGGDDIGESVIRKQKKYDLRINRVICDPLGKSDRNNENSVWEKIDMVLMRYGLYLEVASKDKEDGILQINNHLLTINGFPALFFFADCYKTIKQTLNWIRDADTLKPMKKDDDQCENLYRGMLLDTVWEDVYREKDHSGGRRDSGDAITGY